MAIAVVLVDEMTQMLVAIVLQLQLDMLELDYRMAHPSFCHEGTFQLIGSQCEAAKHVPPINCGMPAR